MNNDYGDYIIEFAYSIWFVRKDISRSRNTCVDVDSPTIFLFWKNVKKRYDCVIISIRLISIFMWTSTQKDEKKSEICYLKFY